MLYSYLTDEEYEDEDGDDDGECPDCGASSDEECDEDCPSFDEEE